MAQLGIPLKPIATNQLFTALYKKQQYNKIIELFELSGGGREEGEREGGELVVDQITCTIALRACGELGEVSFILFFYFSLFFNFFTQISLFL